MNVLFLTTFVLGDAGANAADIFPRLASQDPRIGRVIVADFPKNKHHIKMRQGAEYLRLEWDRTWLRHAARIALKCRREKIDVIHVFYRQQNAVFLILIRLWMICLGCKTQLLMDHRSVNLAKGWRAWRKKCLNLVMQLCTHHLAGNPLAAKTNHFAVFRPHHLIDLGYDSLPPGAPLTPSANCAEVTVWFIGTLKPRNRKSDFLIEVFRHLNGRITPSGRHVRFRVAGLAREDQIRAMRALPNVTYHGQMRRAQLYKVLYRYPGLGLAYMNRAFHEFAPSLKFAEYAIMRFGILASDTIGLRTQAARLQLPVPPRFLPEDSETWAEAILEKADEYEGSQPAWPEAKSWSYPAIFDRQVMSLYAAISRAPPLCRSEVEIPRDEIAHRHSFEQ